MFSDSDAARLLHEAETLNATLITTEKDLVRLRGQSGLAIGRTCRGFGMPAR